MARQSVICALKTVRSMFRRSTMVGEMKSLISTDDASPLRALDLHAAPWPGWCVKNLPYFGSVRSSMTSILFTRRRCRFQSASQPSTASSLPRQTSDDVAILLRPRLRVPARAPPGPAGVSGWPKGMIFTSRFPSVPSKKASVRVRCDPQVLAGQVHRLVVLDRQVVVVDAVDREAERRGSGCSPVSAAMRLPCRCGLDLLRE